MMQLEFKTEQEARLWSAAHDLEKFLGKNAGKTADWPIEIVIRGGDFETAQKLTELLQGVADAVAAYLPPEMIKHENVV